MNTQAIMEAGSSQLIAEPTNTENDRGSDEDAGVLNMSSATPFTGAFDSPTRSAVSETSDTPDPARPGPHAIFKIAELVDMICAELYHKDDSTMEHDRVTHGSHFCTSTTHGLKHFRLVNHLFAAAGARKLFEQVSLDSLRFPMHPKEFVEKLKDFSMHPLAVHVRTFRVGPTIADHGVGYTRALWCDILSRFALAKSIVVSPNDFYLAHTLLGVLAKCPLNITNFDVLLSPTTSMPSPPAGMRALAAKVRTLRFLGTDSNLHCYGGWIEADVVVPVHDAIRAYIGIATGMQHLEVHSLKHWTCTGLSPAWYAFPGTIMFIDPPISEARNLQSLRLKNTLISAPELCKTIQLNSTTLKELHLIDVELSAGYWYEVLETIALILPTLEVFEVGGRWGYLQQHAVSQPLTFIHEGGARKVRDQFWHLLTLNSKDRAAWLKMSSTDSKHFAKQRGEARCGVWQIDSHFWCAGVRLNGSRCTEKRAVIFNREVGLWCTDLEHKETSGAENVWFCRWHLSQTPRAQTWPWEKPNPEY